MEQKWKDKFKMAKMYFRYDRLLKHFTDDSGRIDEEGLRQAITKEYEELKEKLRLQKNNENVKKDLEKIDEYYSIIIDRKKVEYYERLLKTENYFDNNINAEKLMLNASRIEKHIFEENKNPTVINLVVNPEGENPKTVKITKMGILHYKTSINVSSSIDIYSIVKTIRGVDRRFLVATNTLFNYAKEITTRREKGKQISKKDEEFLQLVSQQLSDVNLEVCQRKLNGYMGSIERKEDTVDFSIEPDEYAAMNCFKRQRLDMAR